MRKINRLQSIGAFLLIALGGYVSQSCESCNPEKSNFALIGYSDVPLGETFTLENPSPISDNTVDFKARIYYPSYDEEVISSISNGEEDPDLNNIEVAEGKHPLVVFGHGQYGGGYPTNYLGMTNLMNHLASWGYICISVNLDVVQGGWWDYNYGIPHRGELLLHAIEYMSGLNSDNASIFYNKIDLDTIGLIGHSRGGGGAIYAVNENSTAASPRPILALATISPVDFGTDPLSTDVPHISLYGSWDGDLSRGHGHKIWDDGTRDAHKQFVEIYGANHFNFTDAINFGGEIEEYDREYQQELAQGFINAYFDKFLLGKERYDWPLYLEGKKKINDKPYYIQILSPDHLTIDNGSPLGTENVNNLGGTNDGASLYLFEDELLTDHTDNFYNKSEGLLARWDNSGDSLVFSFTPQDASEYSLLHFRMAQQMNVGLNVEPKTKDFNVVVTDASGNTATVKVSDYLGGLQFPDYSGSLSATSAHQYKSIPRSYKIPIADFGGIDDTQINKIVFLFNLSDTGNSLNTTGAIAIDDVEFSN